MLPKSESFDLNAGDCLMPSSEEETVILIIFFVTMGVISGVRAI